MGERFIDHKILPSRHKTHTNGTFNTRIKPSHKHRSHSTTGQSSTTYLIRIHIFSGTKNIQSFLVLRKKNSRPRGTGTEQGFGHGVRMVTRPLVISFYIIGKIGRAS